MNFILYQGLINRQKHMHKEYFYPIIKLTSDHRLTAVCYNIGPTRILAVILNLYKLYSHTRLSWTYIFTNRLLLEKNVQVCLKLDIKPLSICRRPTYNGPMWPCLLETLILLILNVNVYVLMLQTIIYMQPSSRGYYLTHISLCLSILTVVKNALYCFLKINIISSIKHFATSTSLIFECIWKFLRYHIPLHFVSFSGCCQNCHVVPNLFVWVI